MKKLFIYSFISLFITHPNISSAMTNYRNQERIPIEFELADSSARERIVYTVVQDLDFGSTVTPWGTTGRITLNPLTGSLTTTNPSWEPMGVSGGLGKPAILQVNAGRGYANRPITLSLPNFITISNGTIALKITPSIYTPASLTINPSFDEVRPYTLDENGSIIFSIGGTLNVPNPLTPSTGTDFSGTFTATINL